jgi:hypothetical protein
VFVLESVGIYALLTSNIGKRAGGFPVEMAGLRNSGGALRATKQLVHEMAEAMEMWIKNWLVPILAHICD